MTFGHQALGDINWLYIGFLTGGGVARMLGDLIK
jgi:hypothetical protein